MKKKFILIILLLTILTVNSQTNNFSLLFTNRYKLYKYTYNNKPENVYESPYFHKLRTNDTLEIKKLNNYNITKQKYLEGHGFDNDDTVSVVEWDIFANLNTSFTKLDKVKFLSKDTCLLFYSEKLINDTKNLRFEKWYITPRKFKILKCTESEVILLDKDITDVKRIYYFKAIKQKKK